MTAWTDHVKRMASEFGLSYKGASTDARVKSSFTKAPRKKATKPSAPSEPPKTAKERRTMAASRAMEVTQNKPVDYVPKARQPMSEETKAMLKERRAAKKASEAPPPRTTTLKERRQNASKRAMEITQNKPVDYVPKARKPMSEETKAMLKEKRDKKKADRVYDVSEKFDAFWSRHEGIPAGGPLAGSGVRTVSLATIAKDAASAAVEKVLRSIQPAVTASISDLVGGSAKKARTKKNGQPYKKRESADNKDLRERREKRALLDPALIKPAGVASKMHKPRKPTKDKSKLTPISADEMAFHANLLG